MAPVAAWPSDINMASGWSPDHGHRHDHRTSTQTQAGVGLRLRHGLWQQHRSGHHMSPGGSVGHSYHHKLLYFSPNFSSSLSGSHQSGANWHQKSLWDHCIFVCSFYILDINPCLKYNWKCFLPFCGLAVDPADTYLGCAEGFWFHVFLVFLCDYFLGYQIPVQNVLVYICTLNYILCLPVTVSEFWVLN